MEQTNVWTLVKNLKDLFEFLGILITVAGFIYWRWYNRKKSWWVWQLTFWPKKTCENLVESEPLVVSLKGVIVNVSLFPKVVNEVALTIRRLNDNHRFELDAYALMGPNGFFKTDKGWSNDRQELFRPLVAESRSNLLYHLLFVPVGKVEDRLKDLVAGNYKAFLEFTRPRRKPIRFTFDFQLQESDVAGFLEGDTAFAKLARNLSVD